jgi:hypothetical protein
MRKGPNEARRPSGPDVCDGSPSAADDANGQGRSAKTATYYLAGGVVVGAPGVGDVAGAGDFAAGTGAGLAAGAGADVPRTTELVPRCPSTDRVNAKSMNKTAAIDVALVNSVAPDRAPNAAWLLLPPNALAISPPRPCCRRITIERTRHVRT